MADHGANPLKISFCITCKGRLHHLKESLRQNIENSHDYPNCEFVVLDYDSEDGLEAWMKENFSAEIESGLVRYAKFSPAPHFKFAHAKNMAHRVATGDVLCNLDGDNIPAPGFAQWLNKTFSKNPHTYVDVAFLDRAWQSMRRDEKGIRGIAGRIALSREDFFKLGGYDEAYEGWGGDDTNLVQRAQSLGLKHQPIPKALFGTVIQHSNDDRVRHVAPDIQQESKAVTERSVTKRMQGFIERHTQPPIKPHANPSGEWGCGDVIINFHERHAFRPILSASEGQEETVSSIRIGAMR